MSEPGFLSKLDQRVTALERQRFAFIAALCMLAGLGVSLLVEAKRNQRCEISAEPVGAGR